MLSSSQQSIASRYADSSHVLPPVQQAAQRPTCADTDPATAGAQKFVCDANAGLVYDPSADADDPSEDACCLVSAPDYL
jgi:hypothetical protein